MDLVVKEGGEDEVIGRACWCTRSQAPDDDGRAALRLMSRTDISGHSRSEKFVFTYSILTPSELCPAAGRSLRQGVRVVMELRLGHPKQNPQWRCLVGSNPTLVNILDPFLTFLVDSMDVL